MKDMWDAIPQEEKDKYGYERELLDFCESVADVLERCWLIACLHLLDSSVEGPLLVVVLFALRVSLIVDMDRKIKREVERIGPQDHTGLSEEHEKQVPWIFLARIQKKGLPESASK